MELIKTQNYLNMVRSLRSTRIRANVTAFSNAPTVDDGLNVITMGALTRASNGLYTSNNLESSRELFQHGCGGGVLSMNHDLHSNSDDAKLAWTSYSSSLVGTDHYGHANDSLNHEKGDWGVKFEIPTGLARYYDSTTEIGRSKNYFIAFSDSETEFTVDTIDDDGNLLVPASSYDQYYNVSTSPINPKINRYTFPFSNPGNNYQIKKILILTSYKSHAWNAPQVETAYGFENSKPVIVAGANLDSPIDTSALISVDFDIDLLP